MAHTSDIDGTVATVKYYRNGALIGQSGDGNGIRSWYNAPQGEHSIAAVAVDDSGNTFTKVFDLHIGTGGNVLRQLYKDKLINSWIQGTGFTHVTNSTDQVRQGDFSLKIKANANTADVVTRISSINLNIVPSRDNVALRFWVYIDSAEDSFRQQMKVGILSLEGANTIEARLSLADYVGNEDLQGWKLVTIPLRDFYDNGSYHKGANGLQTADPSEFNWNYFTGASIVSSTSAMTATDYYLDDVSYIAYTVPSPPGITNEGLGVGLVGVSYSSLFQASGGILPYAWDASGLPAGLSIDAVTGELAGTPAEAGQFPVQITVTDGQHNSAVQNIIVTVNPWETILSLPAYEALVLPETYQTVKGWGITPASQGTEFNTKYAAHQALYQELGITLFRIELRGTAGDGDGNLIADVMDTHVSNIQTAVDNGVSQYLLSIFSPPAGMKSNNDISGVHPDGTPASLLPEKEAAFAQYVVNALDYLQAKGVPLPAAFSMQNEPDAIVQYQAAHYSKEQYKRVLKLLRDKLDNSGYSDLPLLAPEVGAYKHAKDFFGADFAELQVDPDFASAVGAFSVHSYTRVTDPDSEVQEYIDNVSQFPDKDRWMTEFSPAIQLEAPTQMDRALASTQVLAADMAWVNNHYWFWWWGWDPRYSIEDTIQETIIDGDGVNSVRKGKMYDILEKIFNHAPPGSTVKRMSATDSSLANTTAHRSDMVAFQNGDSTVAVIVNASGEDKRYTISGLSGASAIVYTVAEHNVQQTRNVAGGAIADVLIPARSVTVAVTSALDTAAPAIQFEKPPTLFFDGTQYISRDSQVEISGRVDEASTVKVNGQAAALDAANRFSIGVELVSEANRIQIEATDTHGNTALLYLNIAYKPDFLAVELDRTSDSVNTPYYLIKGRVNAPATVAISTDEAITDTVVTDSNLAFEHVAALSEGTNTFTIIANDGDGNLSDPVILTVESDSLPPVITVLNTALETEDSEFVLTGHVNEDLAGFTINNVSYAVRPDRSFAVKLPLAEGENWFEIEAEDTFTNVGTKQVAVIFHKTAMTPVASPDAIIHVPKATGEVIIDGYLTEDWQLTAKANKTIFTNDYPVNNIVNFGVKWDEDHLYVGVKVTDDRLKFGSQNVYNNDGIEVFLNPSNEKAGSYAEFDKQLFIGYTLNRDSLYVNSGAAYQTAWHDTADGYTTELAIPWSSLGVVPVPGLAIGFDLANNDKDVASNREHVIVWSGTMDNYRNTSQFGTLILADHVPPPVSPATKPGMPILGDDNGYDTGLLDGDYMIAMNMWYGENGSVYRLYENGQLIDTQYLTVDSPNAQIASTAITGRTNGTYTYYAELTNGNGTTRGQEHTVTVSHANPGKPLLMNDNWDGDGNYLISMNMWWGTNGTTYYLYENEQLIYSQTLPSRSPSAQSAVFTVTGREVGTYIYRAELVNAAGTTLSETMTVHVVR